MFICGYGGRGEGVWGVSPCIYCFYVCPFCVSVFPSVTFWFLLFILLKNLTKEVITLRGWWVRLWGGLGYLISTAYWHFLFFLISRIEGCLMSEMEWPRLHWPKCIYNLEQNQNEVWGFDPVLLVLVSSSFSSDWMAAMLHFFFVLTSAIILFCFVITIEPRWLEHGWLIYHGKFEHIFESLRNSSDSSRKQIFRGIFLFYLEIVCCVYSLELPHRGNSNEYTQHTITV